MLGTKLSNCCDLPPASIHQSCSQLLCQIKSFEDILSMQLVITYSSD